MRVTATLIVFFDRGMEGKGGKGRTRSSVGGQCVKVGRRF